MYFKLFIFILISLCYVKSDSDNGELSVTTEIASSKYNVTEIGAREYLSPNLVALHNMAIMYLPQNLNFLNIIEAYREIIDGVRFEILVNTTNDKYEEFTCRIVLKEIPTLITTWGEKQRELIHSNCSVLDNSDNSNKFDQEFIDNKYKQNTVFNKKNTELTYDYLSILESQIIEPKKQVGQRKNNDSPVECSDNNNIDKLPVDSVQLSVTTILPDTETLETVTTINKESTEEMSGATFALNEDTQYFLDNFFSFYNFGHSINDDQQIPNSETQIVNESATSAVEKISKDYNNHPDQIYSDSNSRKKRSNSKKFHLDKNEQLFEKFQLKYNKIYANSLERQMRYRIFKSHMIKIKQLNKNEQGTAKYGITEFTDMTLTEYQMRTGLRLDFDENRIINPIAEIPDIKLPESFDWRKKGVISEVKNQGNCGSCWAFSVIGNIEGLNAVKTGNLEEFSEQELLDCDTIDSACGGGLMDNAYKAIETIGGLEFETEYPYTAHKDQCHFNSSLSHIKIKGGIDLPKNETAMALWLVANGPISIGLNANAMQFYKGGVSHPWWPLCRPGGIDHGVLIVGFGKAEYPLFNKTLPYWIVKNSWGPKWGEQGYYRIYRGDNTCGINSMASSAVL